MTASTATVDSKVLLQRQLRCFTLAPDQFYGARPRKRGSDAPGCKFRSHAGGLALVASTYCSSMPRSLGAPRARHGRLTGSTASTSVALIILRAVDLAWRLGGFVTNRHG